MKSEVCRLSAASELSAASSVADEVCDQYLGVYLEVNSENFNYMMFVLKYIKCVTWI